MPKPSTLPRWANLAAPADIVDPPSGKKDSGWLTGEKPPHSYFNWWKNLVYQWTVYLDGLTGEALTWTAAHIFQAGVTMTRNSASETLLVQNSGSGPAILVQGLGSGAAISSLANRNDGAIVGSNNNTGGSAAGVSGVCAQWGVRGWFAIPPNTGGAGIRGEAGSADSYGGSFTNATPGGTAVIVTAPAAGSVGLRATGVYNSTPIRGEGGAGSGSAGGVGVEGVGGAGDGGDAGGPGVIGTGGAGSSTEIGGSGVRGTGGAADTNGFGGIGIEGIGRNESGTKTGGAGVFGFGGDSGTGLQSAPGVIGIGGTALNGGIPGIGVLGVGRQNGLGLHGQGYNSTAAAALAAPLSNYEGGKNAGGIFTGANQGSDAGYGCIIGGDSTATPIRGALRITPQQAVPSYGVAGDISIPNSGAQAYKFHAFDGVNWSPIGGRLRTMAGGHIVTNNSSSPTFTGQNISSVAASATKITVNFSASLGAIPFVVATPENDTVTSYIVRITARTATSVEFALQNPGPGTYINPSTAIGLNFGFMAQVL